MAGGRRRRVRAGVRGVAGVRGGVRADAGAGGGIAGRGGVRAGVRRLGDVLRRLPAPARTPASPRRLPRPLTTAPRLRARAPKGDEAVCARACGDSQACAAACRRSYDGPPPLADFSGSAELEGGGRCAIETLPPPPAAAGEREGEGKG